MADRYEIKGKVGRGGIGAIYRAYDNILKRDVAIKRLLPLEETNLNESAENTLNREAEALSRLQHPNVITLFAFEEDEEGPFVVMEYIEGDTIKDIIDNGALSFEDFQIVTTQCLDPLVTAQDLGLLHRDIKPANIMLQWLSSGSFQVKILDFGLAKFSQTPSLQTLDQTGSFLGSIEYLAPEQLELKPLDPRTDIYSLGCVLYYCLAQRAPFEGDNPAVTSTNHLNHIVSHISEVRADIPRPVADWLMTMIARQPDERPKDAREALELFKTAQANQTPRAGVASPAVAIPVSAPVAIPVSAPAVVASGAPVASSAFAASGQAAAAAPSASGPAHAAAAEIPGPVAAPPSASRPAPIARAIPVDAPVPPPGPNTRRLITESQAPTPGSTTKRLITESQAPTPGSTTRRLITESQAPTPGSATKRLITESQAATPGSATKKLIAGSSPDNTSRPTPSPSTQADKIRNKPNATAKEKLAGKSKKPSLMTWIIVILLITIVILLGYLFANINKGGQENSNALPSDPSFNKSSLVVSAPTSAQRTAA